MLRIWWPNIISNKDLWKVTGQEDINLEIRKRNSFIKIQPMHLLRQP
jgi:hypothetical protein